ncbi:MAG: sugar-transporting ATPase [Planctomycetaceae bacterium]|nr:sugar-transporting ATPase [Planctomycetaceae bacterium]MBP63087.1 sugar-transporting ATPase [Planctomycetaceae bacterium]
MKRLLQSKLITDYGMVLVLVLLGALVTWATWGEQHPDDPGAGKHLANGIVELPGDDTHVAVVVRQTKSDTEYAEAIATQLKDKGVTVAAIIQARTPRDARVELVKLGEQQVRVNAIATHHFCFSTWGVLQQSALDGLAANYPSLKGVKPFKPASRMGSTFLSKKNLVSILNQNAPIAIMAIGMTFVIITAGIDLSVGSLMALSALITAVSLRDWFGGPQASSLGLYSAFASAMLVCTLCGVFVGLMVTSFQVPPFVVTLALMMMARGCSFILAGGADSVDIQASGAELLYSGTIFGVPNQIVLMLVLFVLAHVVMSHTALGRYVYAVGGNAQAARLSGVPVFRVIIVVYAICGAAAGLAGVLDASHFTSGRPKAGEFYELQVIAAVVVGGASLMGGEGKIFGTFIGAMILAVIQNGLNMQGVDSYRANVVYGALILVAVLLDQLRNRSSRWA